MFLKETIRPLLQRFQQVPTLLALLVQKCLLYWYKSEGDYSPAAAALPAGTQLARFTGTKVLNRVGAAFLKEREREREREEASRPLLHCVEALEWMERCSASKKRRKKKASDYPHAVASRRSAGEDVALQ